MALKPPDWAALPIHWRLHRQGETTKAFWRRMVDDHPDFLPRLLIEYARLRYDEWRRIESGSIENRGDT